MTQPKPTITQIILDMVAEKFHRAGLSIFSMGQHSAYTDGPSGQTYRVAVDARDPVVVALVTDHQNISTATVFERISLEHPDALELIDRYVDRAMYVQLNYRGRASQHHTIDTLYERILADEITSGLLLKCTGASWSLVNGYAQYEFYAYTLEVDVHENSNDVGVAVVVRSRSDRPGMILSTVWASNPDFLRDLRRIIFRAVGVCKNLLDDRYLDRNKTIDEMWEIINR